MRVQLAWYLEGRIIYTVGTDNAPVIGERNAHILEMLENEAKPPMVHIIIDHTQQYSPEQLTKQPKSVGHYVKIHDDHVREKLYNYPQLGWVISVATPNVAMKMAGTVAAQKNSYRWHSVETLGDALKFLQVRDQSLPLLEVK